MKCPHCGEEIANDSIFCEYCGEKIVATNSPISQSAPMQAKQMTLTTMLLIIIGVMVGLFAIWMYLSHREWFEREQGIVAEEQLQLYGYESVLSERYLTIEDLQGRSAEELRILRNSIYARYGYGFKHGSLYRHFLRYDWYHPSSEDAESIYFNNMTDIERYNVGFIHDYEKTLQENTVSTIQSELRQGQIYDSDGWANVREGQSNTATIIRQLDHGTEILYKTTPSGWYEVYDLETQEFMGYVYKRCIR